MSISYSTNWMGPISQKWVEENGDDWAGGRVDIRGDELENPYGEEFGLPLMKVQDWGRFSAWLQEFTSEKLLTRAEVLEEYYKDGNQEITWFNPDWV